MPDFLVHARRLDTQPYPPFVITAANEAAARKLAQRDWLMLKTVQPYFPSTDEPAPERLTYGPPLKDPRFVRDDLDRGPALRAAAKDRADVMFFLLNLLTLPFGYFVWWEERK